MTPEKPKKPIDDWVAETLKKYPPQEEKFKVRDQTIIRLVCRDEDGKIIYVLPQSLSAFRLTNKPDAK